MKHILFTLLALLLTAVSLASPVSADVNNFTISNYEIDHYLARDGDMRSRLRTVEKITAVFPEHDQNRGLERSIPHRYDNHPTSLRIVSVKNEKGESLEYSTSQGPESETIRIGNPDRYVHGAQTYVITYEQRDVTRYFKDSDVDEFYWDMNGVEWRVPIAKLRATVHIDSELRSVRTGAATCYIGATASADRCLINANGETLTSTATNLRPGENVTLAIGFIANTFAPYQQSLLDKAKALYPIFLLATGLLGLAVFIVACVLQHRWTYRTKETGTLVPEYLPPKETSISTAASVLEYPKAVFTAQLLDFAVRHYIKIHETRAKSTFRSAEYAIEITKDTGDLLAEEQELINDLFDGKPAVGARLALKDLDNNTSLYTRMMDNDKKHKALVRETYQINKKSPLRTQQLNKLATGMLIFAFLTFNPFTVMFAVITYIFGYALWPLSDKGLALRRYLLGLEQYINVAERERIRILQSPQGALKVPSPDVNTPSLIVTLYEKLLPYAVLFGKEKEWSRQLGKYYETSSSSPDWYVGQSAFTAAAFSSSMSSFSTASAASSASSSTSDSSGGGSSGGGGGGGGGGGWQRTLVITP